MDAPLTDEELERVGCLKCAGPVRPQDNAGNAVPIESAVHLFCPECRIWYDPKRPPLAVVGNEGWRRLVAEVRRLRAREPQWEQAESGVWLENEAPSALGTVLLVAAYPRPERFLVGDIGNGCPECLDGNPLALSRVIARASVAMPPEHEDEKG